MITGLRARFSFSAGHLVDHFFSVEPLRGIVLLS
jgi:hypothetical protein